MLRAECCSKRLVRYYASIGSNKTRDGILAHLGTLTEKQKTALRNKSDHLRPFLEEIREERGRATGLDGDEILGTWEDESDDE